MTDTRAGLSSAVYSTRTKTLDVHGWCLPPAKGVSVVLQGPKGKTTVLAAKMGQNRPDLAAAAGEDSGRAGWRAVAPLPKKPIGSHNHLLEIVDAAGVKATRKLAIQIVDDRPAPKSQSRPIARRQP